MKYTPHIDGAHAASMEDVLDLNARGGGGISVLDLIQRSRSDFAVHRTPSNIGEAGSILA